MENKIVSIVYIVKLKNGEVFVPHYIIPCSTKEEAQSIKSKWENNSEILDNRMKCIIMDLE